MEDPPSPSSSGGAPAAATTDATIVSAVAGFASDTAAAESQPVLREDQIVNAVSFLSHPKVREGVILAVGFVCLYNTEYIVKAKAVCHWPVHQLLSSLAILLTQQLQCCAGARVCRVSQEDIPGEEGTDSS
jgi:hypothetical protein